MASTDRVDNILRMLADYSAEDQRAVLGHLRRLYPIHEIEAQWGVPAEVILEAIARSPDLSQRGVRGLIAEAYFEVHVLPSLRGWENVTPQGNHAFDFQVRRDDITASIQVKTQRKKAGRPMAAREGYRSLSEDKYVVETQRTRAGKDSSGADTRPYRFGEFDILAVNMEPVTGDWTQFRYTLERSGAHMASTDRVDNILRMLADYSAEDQRAVLGHLRRLYPIHEIEAQWGVPAEVILEAIARSPDLSQRGVRGLIAEAYFEVHVLPSLRGWENVTPQGNHAFDFQVRRDDITASIQVKTQRKKAGRPMAAREGYRSLSEDKYVVETQRTRAGKDSSGADTRPYRFGEFDILAVNMEPVTGDWTQFRYTLERWLLPRENDHKLILKFQPVSLEPNDDWTDDLAVCLQWYEGDIKKRISR